MAVSPWLTFENIKELSEGKITIAGPYADDVAAAAGGVLVGQLYHTAAGAVLVRLV